MTGVLWLWCTGPSNLAQEEPYTLGEQQSGQIARRIYDTLAAMHGAASQIMASNLGLIASLSPSRAALATCSVSIMQHACVSGLAVASVLAVYD